MYTNKKLIVKTAAINVHQQETDSKDTAAINVHQQETDSKDTVAINVHQQETDSKDTAEINVHQQEILQNTRNALFKYTPLLYLTEEK